MTVKCDKWWYVFSGDHTQYKPSSSSSHIYPQYKLPPRRAVWPDCTTCTYVCKPLSTEQWAVCRPHWPHIGGGGGGPYWPTVWEGAAAPKSPRSTLGTVRTWCVGRMVIGGAAAALRCRDRKEGGPRVPLVSNPCQCQVETAFPDTDVTRHMTLSILNFRKPELYKKLVETIVKNTHYNLCLQKIPMLKIYE